MGGRRGGGKGRGGGYNSSAGEMEGHPSSQPSDKLYSQQMRNNEASFSSQNPSASTIDRTTPDGTELPPSTSGHVFSQQNSSELTIEAIPLDSTQVPPSASGHVSSQTLTYTTDSLPSTSMTAAPSGNRGNKKCRVNYRPFPLQETLFDTLGETADHDLDYPRIVILNTSSEIPV